MTRPLELSEIEQAIANAPSMLVVTDFDGVICSTAAKPEWVHTPGRTVLAMQRLAASPKATLAVLSGRALSDLRTRLPVDAILGGNHGLEIGGKQFDFVHPEAQRLTDRLQHVCVAVEHAIAHWPGAWVENKLLTATVHVRDCSVDDWIPIRDSIRSVVRPMDDVFCMATGRAAFDITPRIGWDKGSALKYIVRESAIEDVLTLCVGDDETDETMFRAVPNGISIRVCPNGESDAMYSLPEAAAVTELFEWIADTLESSPRRSTLRLNGGCISRRTPVF